MLRFFWHVWTFSMLLLLYAYHYYMLFWNYILKLKWFVSGFFSLMWKISSRLCIAYLGKDKRRHQRWNHSRVSQTIQRNSWKYVWTLMYGTSVILSPFRSWSKVTNDRDRLQEGYVLWLTVMHCEKQVWTNALLEGVSSSWGQMRRNRKPWWGECGSNMLSMNSHSKWVSVK